VTLVAILDADKEGFLRSDTALIQTIGRAARNVGGKVLMYADNITGSMQRAIEETDRRRKVQADYNRDNNVVPATIAKQVRETVRSYQFVAEGGASYDGERKDGPLDIADIPMEISRLEKEMMAFARDMEFESAAKIRDQIFELRKVAGLADPARNLIKKPKLGKDYKR
jgi:excinuclease ABC subunit B